MPWQNAPQCPLPNAWPPSSSPLIVVIGIAVVALNLTDRGVAADPSAPASASPAESPAPTDAPTDEPSPADEDDVLATLAEIEEQVIAIRGLPAADIGAPELLTRAELQDALLALFEEDYPPEEQAEDNASLRALGLLEPGQDIAALQLQLLGGVVLGFYDDDEKRMVVVTDEGLNAPGEVHLRPRIHPRAAGRRIRDRVAGHARPRVRTIARLRAPRCSRATRPSPTLAWAFANLEPQELAEITSAPQADTTGIPSWLIEQIAGFPVQRGLPVGGRAGRRSAEPRLH